MMLDKVNRQEEQVIAPPKVLIVSGDGILPTFSWGLSGALKRLGAATDVIGAFHHFRRRRTPQCFADHLETRLCGLKESDGPVYLVGYSFGAVLAHSVPHLGAETRKALSRVVLIAPAAMTGFVFHPAGWFNGHGPEDEPTAPAIERLADDGHDVLLLYGEKDAPRAEPAHHEAIARRILPGGHSLGGAYDEVARHVLDG